MRLSEVISRGCVQRRDAGEIENIYEKTLYCTKIGLRHEQACNFLITRRLSNVGTSAEFQGFTSNEKRKNGKGKKV